MWNTILFDLDGTLTDSQEGIINSIICALEHFGIHEERASLLEFVGPPLDESFRLRYQFSEEQIAVGIETFREYFNRRGWLENAPYPGAAELLAELRGAGKRLLVATSKPENMAVRVLEHFGLAQYFDRICGAPPDNQEGARKVCVVRAALRWAGIEDLSSAVMVGDRRHDIEGAREAGWQAVGVLYGYGSREELEKAGAAYIAADMDELRGVLL